MRILPTADATSIKPARIRCSCVLDFMATLTLRVEVDSRETEEKKEGFKINPWMDKPQTAKIVGPTAAGCCSARRRDSSGFFSLSLASHAKSQQLFSQSRPIG